MMTILVKIRRYTSNTTKHFQFDDPYKKMTETEFLNISFTPQSARSVLFRSISAPSLIGVPENSELPASGLQRQ